MKHILSATALSLALVFSGAAAQAELIVECNEIQTGLDSMAIFAARDVLPEGEIENAETIELSEAAAAANSLIAERMGLADAVRLYTQGGTRGNHERETIIAQQGLLCSDGKTASLAVIWRGEQADGSYGQSMRTCVVNLETGEEVTFGQIFDDAEGAAQVMEAIIEQDLLDEMSDYMEYADLLPMPRDSFYYDASGLTICYDAERYRYFDGTSGAVHFAWHEIAAFIGADSPVAALARPQEADALAMAQTVQAEKGFGGYAIFHLGEKLGEALNTYTLLTEPDYTRSAKVYLFQEPQLRGLALEIPRYADTEDEETPVTGIRAGRISWHGLVTGQTTREEIVSLLSQPEATKEYSEGEAEDNLLCPGESLFYTISGYVLEAHLDEEGVLNCLILRESMPE